MSSIIFGLQSSYMLEYCWLFSLFLRRSAWCFTGAQRELDSAPTYLTAIFSLSGRASLTPCLSSVACCRKAHWYIGWNRALGNGQRRQTHVKQVDGVSDMGLPLCGSVCGRIQKGEMPLPNLWTFIQGRQSPGTFSDATYFSLSMPLVPFQLLP